MSKNSSRRQRQSVTPAVDLGPGKPPAPEGQQDPALPQAGAVAPRSQAAITLARGAVDPDAVAIVELFNKGKNSRADALRCHLQAGLKLSAKKATMPHGQWGAWPRQTVYRSGLQHYTSTPNRLMRAARKYSASTPNLDDFLALEISREMWGNGESEEVPPVSEVEPGNDSSHEGNHEPPIQASENDRTAQPGASAQKQSASANFERARNVAAEIQHRGRCAR